MTSIKVIDEALDTLLAAAEAYATATHGISQIDEAVELVWQIRKSAGVRPISAHNSRLDLRHRLVYSIATRHYDGDEKKARSFARGLTLNRSADGVDVGPTESEDAEAFALGTATDPSFAAHKAAQAAATVAFRERFSVDAPTTAKGRVYWIKKYHAKLAAL